MPVFAVKSFDSSTSALAGSHAAQQSVIVLVCACTADAKASIVETAMTLAPAISFFMTDTSWWWFAEAGPGSSEDGANLSMQPALGAGLFRATCLVSCCLLNIARAARWKFHAAAQRE